MVYITPLVINTLGGGHTDRWTHTYTHTYRHANQINLKKPCALGLRLRVPGLEVIGTFISSIIKIYAKQNQRVAIKKGTAQ